MKYLDDYTQEATTALLNDNGAFFAFSNQQLDERKKEGVAYVSMGAGLICPKENINRVAQGFKDIIKGGIALDLSENGKEAIIERELANHEAYYTGDISTTVDYLNGYGFTREDILAVFRATKINHES